MCSSVQTKSLQNLQKGVPHYNFEGLISPGRVYIWSQSIDDSIFPYCVSPKQIGM